jgi:GH15 family glucan-1,4-alpha-glucosidase
MASRIEDYAIVGDCQSVALVSRDGSIDWLCLPYFDSGACFAALLGTPDNGRWQIAPTSPVRRSTRRYRPGTMVLETDFETEDGIITIIDAMPVRDRTPDLVRAVVGRRGTVRTKMELIIRFDYGRVVPWVRRIDGGITAVAGPDLLRLVTPVSTHGEDLTTIAEFEVHAGERIPFVLTWSPSHQPVPLPVNAEEALEQTTADWQKWSSQTTLTGPYADIVQRSLLTLKALTFAPTGGIVAAATTSLPERIGGVRNWDYRYCWLRDATLSLNALMSAGFQDEAAAWREWLLRAIAGDPAELQILYGLAGERRIVEATLPWLAGYEGSRPVRIGNAATTQFQLDVYGEVMAALYLAHQIGLAPQERSWDMQRAMMKFVVQSWREPDEGIWEVRGPRRQFTHSKVMAWLALDCAVKSVEAFHLEGPVDLWRKTRDEVHASVCREGYNREIGAFVQSYGSKTLDASLLMLPLVGFLPATDERVRSTVRAIESSLMVDGFVRRYAGETGVDGLPPGEGAFLPCSFWLVDNYVLQGRAREGRALFERLVALTNDVGLLAEEYDPRGGRLIGNFPQAFSHVCLINSAQRLAGHEGPLESRP